MDTYHLVAFFFFAAIAIGGLATRQKPLLFVGALGMIVQSGVLWSASPVVRWGSWIVLVLWLTLTAAQARINWRELRWELVTLAGSLITLALHVMTNAPVAFYAFLGFTILFLGRLVFVIGQIFRRDILRRQA